MLAESVSADCRVSRVVRQRVPHQRTSHGESPPDKYHEVPPYVSEDLTRTSRLCHICRSTTRSSVRRTLSTNNTSGNDAINPVGGRRSAERTCRRIVEITPSRALCSRPSRHHHRRRRRRRWAPVRISRARAALQLTFFRPAINQHLERPRTSSQSGNVAKRGQACGRVKLAVTTANIHNV